MLPAIGNTRFDALRVSSSAALLHGYRLTYMRLRSATSAI